MRAVDIRRFASKQIAGGGAKQFRWKPAPVGRHGFRPLYRSDSRCPCCDQANWFVGRVSAECARCGTALPLAPFEERPETE